MNGIASSVRTPRFCADVVPGKGARIERNAYAAGFTCIELNTCKALELLARTSDCGVVFREIKLGNVSSGAPAGVGNIERDFITDAVLRACFQVCGSADLKT